MDVKPCRKIRHKRHPLMNVLSVGQKQQFKCLIDTYTPDLHDPAAVEVLLVLLEICRILDLLPHEVDRLFTSRVLKALASYGDTAPPKARPSPIQRAWVWLSNQPQPELHQILFQHEEPHFFRL